MGSEPSEEVVSSVRTFRVRMSIAARREALETLCDDPRPAVRALVNGLSEATTERGHHSLGLDWERLRREREVAYPVPSNASHVSVANAAHGWARRHGLKITTRSTPRQVTVYVIAGHGGNFA